jgi:hypothetical protein
VGNIALPPRWTARYAVILVVWFRAYAIPFYGCSVSYAVSFTLAGCDDQQAQCRQLVGNLIIIISGVTPKSPRIRPSFTRRETSHKEHATSFSICMSVKAPVLQGLWGSHLCHCQQASNTMSILHISLSNISTSNGTVQLAWQYRGKVGYTSQCRDYATSLMSGKAGFNSWHRQTYSLFSMGSRLTLHPLGMKLTTYLCLQARLRMHASIPLLTHMFSCHGADLCRKSYLCMAQIYALSLNSTSVVLPYSF